jgi:hypothetical protein
VLLKKVETSRSINCYYSTVIIIFKNENMPRVLEFAGTLEMFQNNTMEPMFLPYTHYGMVMVYDTNSSAMYAVLQMRSAPLVGDSKEG